MKVEELKHYDQDIISISEDFLPAFKKYYIAMMESMSQKGLEKAEIAEDKKDVFQLNVTYCAWAEVAKAIGNPYYCYYSTCFGNTELTINVQYRTKYPGDMC